MSLNKKNISIFISIIFMSLLTGSIFWEIFERLIHLIPKFSQFTLTVKNPVILLDLYVISLGFRANPGTLLGFITGIILFFRI